MLRRHRTIVHESRPLDHLEGVVAGQLEKGNSDALNVVSVHLGKVGNQVTFIAELSHQQIHGGLAPVLGIRCVAGRREMQLQEAGMTIELCEREEVERTMGMHIPRRNL